jgi:hypothetical protein
MYINTAIIENDTEILQKLQVEPSCDSAIPPWVYIQRKWN